MTTCKEYNQMVWEQYVLQNKATTKKNEKNDIALKILNVKQVPSSLKISK